MRLLFDANLSPKLARKLADFFPGSSHVFETGLEANASDESIWMFAKNHHFGIVTADFDFIRLAETFGPPPKVVRIEKCIYKTKAVEVLIRRNALRITELEHSEKSVLILKNTL